MDYEGACATMGCHGRVCLNEDVERRARRTHETFYCSAGHPNYFAKKTDQEVRIEQLERQRDHFQETMREWMDEARRCPWPGCRRHVYSHRGAMIDHMQRVHGMPSTKAFKAERESAAA